jgi:hypothetical protein
MLSGNMEQTKGRTYAFLSFFAEFADAADPVPHDTLEPIERIARAALVAKADRDAAMAKLMTGPTESWNSWLFGALLDAACDVLAVVGVYGKEAWNMMNLQLLVMRIAGSALGKLFAGVIGSNSLVCLVILLVEVAISLFSLLSLSTGLGAPVAAALAVFASSALSKSGSNCPSILSFLRPLIYNVAQFVQPILGKDSWNFDDIRHAINTQLPDWNSLYILGPGIAYSTVDAVATSVLRSRVHKHLVCFIRVGVHLAFAYSAELAGGSVAAFADNYRKHIVPSELRIAIAHASADAESKKKGANEQPKPEAHEQPKPEANDKQNGAGTNSPPPPRPPPPENEFTRWFREKNGNPSDEDIKNSFFERTTWSGSAKKQHDEYTRARQ